MYAKIYIRGSSDILYDIRLYGYMVYINTKYHRVMEII